MTITQLITAINTGGVVTVLVLAVWLGLRGDVVTGEQLRDCRMRGDRYLEQLLRYQVPIPQTNER
jgi:hypothetical protein